MKNPKIVYLIFSNFKLFETKTNPFKFIEIITNKHRKTKKKLQKRNIDRDKSQLIQEIRNMEEQTFKGHLEEDRENKIDAENIMINGNNDEDNKQIVEEEVDDESSQQLHEAAETLLEIKKQCESESEIKCKSLHLATAKTDEPENLSTQNTTTTTTTNRRHNLHHFHHRATTKETGGDQNGVGSEEDDDEEKNVLRQLQTNDENDEIIDGIYIETLLQLLL